MLLLINQNFKTKYCLAVLNSLLLGFYFRNKYAEFDDVFPQIKINHFKSLPIKNVTLEFQEPFIEKVDVMLNLSKEIEESSQKFQRMLQRKFDLEELRANYKTGTCLAIKSLLLNLARKSKLTLAQEAEWEDYFNSEKAKALEIKKQIDDTDKEIDRMVYALYELTEEEIKIVEGQV
jgi:hypothetical protein